LFALVRLVTYNRKLAEVIVAPTGNDDVLKRNNAVRTSYPPYNGPARRTPKLDPDDHTVGDPVGGYTPVVAMSFTDTSPSSPPDATDTVNVPDVPTAATTPVSADVADADPAPFDAVTTTCIDDPTSALVNRYELEFDPTFTQLPAAHRCH
jgi:hypothetical protein